MFSEVEMGNTQTQIANFLSLTEAVIKETPHICKSELPYFSIDNAHDAN